MRIFKTMKLKTILVALLTITVMATGITYAYLKSQTENLNNQFTVGEITTHIEEEPEIVNATIKKDPKVVNDGPNECIVRMRVTISPKEIDDFLKEDRINYDTINWKYNETDGFWYYQGVVPVTEGKNVTKPLFTEITGLVNDQGAIIEQFAEVTNFQIALYQEAVQAVVWGDGDDSINAANADGSYNEANANRIWEYYLATQKP